MTLVEWIPDKATARRWSGSDLGWPLDGPLLALKLYREASTPLALIDRDGQLAGFGEYYPKAPDRLRLARLIIDPARRGRGVVDVLMHQLVAHASDYVVFDTVELGVFADNTAAIRAYRRLGFLEYGDGQSRDMLSMQRPGFG